MHFGLLSRRITALLASVSAVVLTTVVLAQSQTAPAVTRPVIAEQVSPVERISPVARDGYAGTAFVRRPPGKGPFPAVVIIHPGLTAWSTDALRGLANGTQASRFLAAGYVVAATTYRSRDADPQTTVSLQDSLATVDHVRKLPFVDARSLVIWGCSGGGDLALEVAAATNVAAIAPEEPASILLTGIFNKDFPKQGAVHTPADSAPIFEDPKGYYTPQYQKLTREKLGRIKAPILLLQGDPDRPDLRINLFNALVLVPELRALGKTLEVKSYTGQPHCFAFGGNVPARAAVALQAWQDADAFYRRHMPTKPTPIDPKLVTNAPIVAKTP
jgi:dipeptidyl aminopeptidase/acylaminoacyl peptidase